MSPAQSSSSRNRDQAQAEAPLGIEKFHRISGKKGLEQGWKGHLREEFRQEFRRHPETSVGFAGGGGRSLSERRIISISCLLGHPRRWPNRLA